MAVKVTKSDSRVAELSRIAGCELDRGTPIGALRRETAEEGKGGDLLCACY